jgi:CDP-6-deoxy-D-xylo-4-hexulose-3-dehydrase
MARSFGTWGRIVIVLEQQIYCAMALATKIFQVAHQEFPELIIDHKYVFNRIGWNLKPLDLQGAIGLEQLKKLEYICKTRQSNKNSIQSYLKKYVHGLNFPNTFAETDWVPFGVPIICKDKKQKKHWFHSWKRTVYKLVTILQEIYWYITDINISMITKSIQSQTKYLTLYFS